ncbi:MAG: tetratricopeptide repeat protein [Terracidiphilus sp.]
MLYFGLLGSCVGFAPLAAFAQCTPPSDLRAQIAAHPTAENYANLGNWFADHKQFECAAKAFASASAINPSSSSLAYLWGLSLSSAGNDSAALVPLRKAAALGPSDIRPHLVSAAALDKLKRTAEAEAEWRKALAIDPASAPALDGLSRDLIDQKDYPSVVALLAAPSAAGQLSPEQCVNLGIAFAAAARLEEAARVLRDGLNTAPDSIQIANELAVVLLLMGRDREALSIFELAIQKHPDDQATKVLYLHALVNSHAEKAAPYAKQLLIEYPRQWEVLYLNGVLVEQDGDYEQAKDYLQRSVSLNPDFGQSRTLLGNVLARLGDPHGAKEHLEKGIALGDDSPEVEYSLANVLRSLGETDAATRALRRYQELKSSQSGRAQAAGKAESGDQSMANGNFAQAAASYRDALTSDPDEAILHYKLSRALGKMNDVAGETSELSRTIELDPKLAEAQNQMGYLAAHNGDLEHAETYFRLATQAEPSYVGAWINLAAALAGEQRWVDARQAVDHALQIDPENAQARELSQELSKSPLAP